jgi:hypothetical protein
MGLCQRGHPEQGRCSVAVGSDMRKSRGVAEAGSIQGRDRGSYRPAEDVRAGESGVGGPRGTAGLGEKERLPESGV